MPKTVRHVGLVTVGLLVLLAAWPLLQAGLPNVADAPIHMFRTAEWVRSWQAGIPLPGWAPNLAYGYGYPLFLFAPPLFYALAGILHIVGLSLTASAKIVVIGCLAVAGCGMYALVKRRHGQAAAVVAAAAYVLAPFLLRETYLYGGNFPQLMAMALFPAVLWAFQRWMEEGHWSGLLLAGGLLGALLLSHNFQAMVFTPLLAGYVLVVAQGATPGGRWQRLARAGSALGLGLGLTAFFWLPALAERQWTRAQEQIYIEASPFYLRFLELRDLIAPPIPLDASAANPALPFTLGTVIVAMLALGLLMATLRLSLRSHPQGGRATLLFLASLLLLIFMLTPRSAWIWANVPLLAVAEFPWRLMGLAALCCAWLVGEAISVWSTERWSGIVAAVGVVAIILGSAVYLYPPKPFVLYGPDGTPSLLDQARYELATGTIGTTTLGEYLPLTVQQVPSPRPLAPALLAGNALEKLDRSTLPPDTQAELVEHTPHLDHYRFTSEQPFVARFFTFFYPGWQATVDGTPAEIQVSSPEGLIEVPIPAGERELSLRFTGTPIRTAARIISVLSLVLAAGVLITGLLTHVWRARRHDAEQNARSPRAHQPLAFIQSATLPLMVVVLAMLLIKVLLVDPYTDWFRRQSPVYEIVGLSHPVGASLDGTVALVGYELDEEAVRAGRRLHLTLYWQALQLLAKDYSIFVHMDVPPYGTTLFAADKTPPGDAQAQIDIPTGHWELETYVRDEYRFTIPQDLPPVRYTLRVGLYDPISGESLGEGLALQELQVLPARAMRPSQIPNRQRVRLGDEIELLGYALETGPPQILTLFWRAQAPIEEDYVVFVHVVDEHGTVRDQKDGPPQDGMYPTTAWWPGQIIADRRAIPPLADGDRLLVGMYDLATLQRLPAYGDGGKQLPDDAVPLSVQP